MKATIIDQADVAALAARTVAQIAAEAKTQAAMATEVAKDEICLGGRKCCNYCGAFTGFQNRRQAHRDKCDLFRSTILCV